MKITLSKSQWEQIGKNSGWIKKAQLATPSGAPQPATQNQIGTQMVNPQQQTQQQQQPKQMAIFNQNYQSLMRSLNSLRPDVQNKASSAFSAAFNSLQVALSDPNSWM